MASTIVLPEPANPRILCGPSIMRIAALFCSKSKVAISDSIFSSILPLVSSLKALNDLFLFLL